ncbi:MAG: hypothetical protein ACYCYF_10275 [Anaerolineae bacterium]
MSTSQDPFGEPKLAHSSRSDATPSAEPPSPGPLSGRPLARIVFWMLIVALYLLGALSLLVRGWLDSGSVVLATPVTTVMVNTAIATDAPPTQTAATVAPGVPPPASATPHPTLTPRRTLYPTLTPRP